MDPHHYISPGEPNEKVEPEAIFKIAPCSNGNISYRLFILLGILLTNLKKAYDDIQQENNFKDKKLQG